MTRTISAAARAMYQRARRVAAWIGDAFRGAGTSARNMYQRLLRRAEDLPPARLLRERREVGALRELRAGAPTAAAAPRADRIALLAEVDQLHAATERRWRLRLYRVDQPRIGTVGEPSDGDLFEAVDADDEWLPSGPFLGFSPCVGAQIPSHLRTRVIGAGELERCYTPHHRWRCLGCKAALTLQHGDERLGTGQAPRCDRCGAWTASVHPDSPPARPS